MTLVIAHRGASAAHPPGNTVEAFQAARALGADWVELDVRPTADGALVVHHDHHLADGRTIATLRAAELPEWVPTLQGALDACDGMGVNVEIKVDPPVAGTPHQDRLVGDVVDLLVACGTPERFLVTSFEWPVVAEVHQRAAALATGLLGFDLSTGPDLLDAAAAGGHRAVNPWDPFVTDDLVHRAHGLGLEVHAWTVDDPARVADLVTLGVDGIITNRPDMARSLVEGDRPASPAC
jgi:glycerophosphoryl diester phosphodiesterase